MNRHDMIERIGSKYLTTNIEAGEYSYVVEAGSKAKLEQYVGHTIKHFKLDLRFEDDDVVILVETKQRFVDSDIEQLAEYLEEERAFPSNSSCYLQLSYSSIILPFSILYTRLHIVSTDSLWVAKIQIELGFFSRICAII